jgi:hypothetical protein
LRDEKAGAAFLPVPSRVFQKTPRATSLKSRRSQDAGEKPVSDDSGRWNGAQWRGQPLKRFTGGAEMERSGDGLNWWSENSHQLTKKCQK